MSYKYNLNIIYVGKANLTLNVGNLNVRKWKNLHSFPFNNLSKIFHFLFFNYLFVELIKPPKKKKNTYVRRLYCNI